jgi:hypothetical protein
MNCLPVLRVIWRNMPRGFNTTPNDLGWRGMQGVMENLGAAQLALKLVF